MAALAFETTSSWILPMSVSRNRSETSPTQTGHFRGYQRKKKSRHVAPSSCHDSILIAGLSVSRPPGVLIYSCYRLVKPEIVKNLWQDSRLTVNAIKDYQMRSDFSVWGKPAMMNSVPTAVISSDWAFRETRFIGLIWSDPCEILERG